MRSIWLISLVVVVEAIIPHANAATFPWKGGVLSYRANSVALSKVLEDVFITQQRPVVISDTVKELAPVSGEFRKPPRQLFNELVQSYGLVNYFDGTTMYVTTLAENKTVLRKLTKVGARDVERAAREFGYLDRRFGFNAMSASSALQLSGPPAYIERMSDVVAILEANATQQVDSAKMGFRVIPLKHAWAEDVTYNIGGRATTVRGVANSLRQLVIGMDGLDGEAVRVRETGPETPGLPVAPDQRPVSALDALFNGSANARERVETKPPLPEMGHVPSRESNADLRLSQRPGAFIRIVGDSRMNAVVVMAPVDMLTMLEDVVRDLDVEPELVQIEAAIIDVQDGVLKEIGFDWALQGSHFRIASTTSGANIGRDLGNGDRVRGSGPNFSIFGGSSVLSFLSRIHALQEEGKANVLSRPKLATLNGIEAVLTNQQVFYPRVSSERVAQLYQVDVGLQMRVVPVVVRRSGGNADIRLQVFIEDGSLGSQRIDNLPVTSKSAITTQALVRNGESLLIGGYVRDVSDHGEAKVPLLGDIPLLGALFRFRSTQTDRRERLFLITPKLLATRDTGDTDDTPQAIGANQRERMVIERVAENFTSRDAATPASDTAQEPGSATEEVVFEPIGASAHSVSGRAN
ncbi:type III secretion outer membrane pore, YscC/HrcC family protein [Burkholderia ubonensis]|uniref:type III secretion system outer membrane ring subunit SctC n=1 Tax=Burkholderia ubonensis TaxID=101571 RepID=UPI0007552063|nr:type III secretion system outer membrane ring subunit SctC [Burkholderia ubonensis]KVD55006.1 type III secretion outer membrane pore, YscC/HrcC family protein [Burkholderia ubonensis]